MSQLPELPNHISAILLEYAAQAEGASLAAPLPASLALRDGLGIDSYSLISIVIRLGDELGVDAVASGLELHRLETVGSLYALGEELAKLAAQAAAG